MTTTQPTEASKRWLRLRDETSARLRTEIHDARMEELARAILVERAKTMLAEERDVEPVRMAA